jgi:hypothetical protein
MRELAVLTIDLVRSRSKIVHFTLPTVIADIAYQNKAVVHDLLFKASAENLITIAADPASRRPRRHHLGSPYLGFGAHPSSYIHMIVPGGGISLDGERWVACRPGLLPAGARALAPVLPVAPRRPTTFKSP